MSAPPVLAALVGLLLALAGPGPIHAEGSQRVSLAVSPPAGFTAAPTKVAQRAAQPLIELVRAAGLQPLGVTRARLTLLGAPGDPVATLLTAQVRVLTRMRGAAPVLDQAALEAAREFLQQEAEGAIVLGPTARTAAGLAGHELGCTQPREGGRARLSRMLLLPVAGAVLVLALDVQDADEGQWSATWARLVRTLRPEYVPRESGLPLVPALPIVLAAAALLTAAIQGMRRATARTTPERPSEAFVAHLEQRGREPRSLR